MAVPANRFDQYFTWAGEKNLWKIHGEGGADATEKALETFKTELLVPAAEVEEVDAKEKANKFSELKLKAKTQEKEIAEGWDSELLQPEA